MRVNFAGRALSVFAAMVALDIVFALYVIETAARNAVKGSAYASLIQVFNLFVVAAFVKDNRLVVPCAAGAFVGTWLAITYF